MDASEVRYDKLVDRVEALYGEGRFRSAAELLDSGSDGLDAWTRRAGASAGLLAGCGW